MFAIALLASVATHAESSPVRRRRVPVTVCCCRPVSAQASSSLPEEGSDAASVKPFDTAAAPPKQASLAQLDRSLSAASNASSSSTAASTLRDSRRSCEAQPAW